MKKLLFIFTILICGFASFGQIPNRQNVSNASTQYHIPNIFADSTFRIPIKDTLNNPATIYTGSMTIRPQDTVDGATPAIYVTNGVYWNDITGIERTSLSVDGELCFWKRGTVECYPINTGSGSNSSDSLAHNYDSTKILHYRNGVLMGDSIYLIHTVVYQGPHFSITNHLDGKLMDVQRVVDSVYLDGDSLRTRYVDGHTTATLNGSGASSGTVTDVAALTLGTTGTDLSSSVANGTTTPVITLNVPTASASNRGVLSSSDWTLFNAKQAALSGTGFVKISGTTISYDNSTYLTNNQAVTVTATGDATGTSTSSATAPSLPLTLATVNSNVGSFTNASITVNGKGLITAASSGSAGASLSSANIFTTNGAVSAPSQTYNGTWYSGGSATTTKPMLLIEPSGTTSTGWSTGGTGLGINGATGFAGNLIDIQLNGAARFSLTSAGSATFAGGIIGQTISYTALQATSGSTTSNLYIPGGSTLGSSTSTAQYIIGANNSQFRVGIRGGTATTATAGTDVWGLLIGNNTYTEAASGTSALSGGVAILTQSFTNGSGATTDFQNLYVGDAPTGGVNNYAINSGSIFSRSTITGTSFVKTSGTSSQFLKADGSSDATVYAPLASPTFTGTVVLPSTTSIGTITNTELSYIDGVTSSIQTQLDAKAPLASPTFTGVPAAPTASPGANSTQVATTAYADAIGTLKANIASPTFTGTPAAPTAANGTKTTQIATTAYVQNNAAHTVTYNNTQLSNTGSTTENLVFTGSIPGNSIGANGSYHITAIFTFSNNTNGKTFRIKFNGITVGQFLANTATTNVSAYYIVRNRNATNVQISGPSGSNGGGAFGQLVASAVTTYTFDTTADIAVTITEQLANSGDTMAVEAFEIVAVP